ncbi:hypothetical protein CEE69_16990 [Rhodopirellula bahusiensis]|uniref:Uncharacterized protein n=1 Tax=Rhodopirellula bahusiensis TaxID=2014065 RepID=A0A2G1W5A1_9BACT|nr:hypothetical protein CEE69_16990 [Rhodopirellula bahusiensis]
MDPTQLTFSDRFAIVDANYGREFGWHVLSDSDEPIATLTDPQFADMFWTAYTLTPVDGHAVTQSEGFWHPDCHRIRNLGFPNFIVDTFGHYDPETNRVTIRFDYINVDFTWPDRFLAPLWFLRRWFK